MPLFRVSFLKVVADSTGHEHEICQRVLDLSADDGDKAVSAGQLLFC